jgi:hypothetical protein
MRVAILRAALLAGVAGLYLPFSAFSQESDSLSISGTPPACVQVNQPYAFTPNAIGYSRASVPL